MKKSEMEPTQGQAGLMARVLTENIRSKRAVVSRVMRTDLADGTVELTFQFTIDEDIPRAPSHQLLLEKKAHYQ